MTVNELIQILGECDPDAQVKIQFRKESGRVKVVEDRRVVRPPDSLDSPDRFVYLIYSEL